MCHILIQILILTHKGCAEDVFLFYHKSNLPKTLEVHLSLSSVIFLELRNWWKMLWCSNHAWHGPAVTCCPAYLRLYSFLPFCPLHSLYRCNREPKLIALPLSATEVSPLSARNMADTWVSGEGLFVLLFDLWALYGSATEFSYLCFRWRSVCGTTLYQRDLQGRYWKILLHL